MPEFIERRLDSWQITNEEPFYVFDETRSKEGVHDA
jgi:hypothetical protein